MKRFDKLIIYLINNLWFKCTIVCLVEVIIFSILSIAVDKTKIYLFLGTWIIAFVFFMILTIRQIYNDHKKNQQWNHLK